MAKKHVSKKKRPSKKASTALVRQTPADTGPMSVFERLARDKTIDVEKLQGLITLQKDIMAVQARSAFTAAFSEMHPQLPTITKKGIIKNRAGDVQSRYAKLEDIQRAVNPILAAHGFTLRHRTEWPKEKPGIIRVVGMLSHNQGHVEESAFEGPLDKSDYRTEIQSMGSTVSYGRRYTTIDLLNITQIGLDDDGQKGVKPVPTVGTVVDVKKDAKHANEDDAITEPQVQRLWVIIRSSGRPETEVKMWLKVRYNLDSTKKIPRRLYEEICSAIERPGPLLIGREPGEDDA